MLFGLYCIKVTYLHNVNKMLSIYLTKIIEVYVGDMLVKSLTMENHADYLHKMVTILRSYKIKLNKKVQHLG